MKFQNKELLYGNKTSKQMIPKITLIAIFVIIIIVLVTPISYPLFGSSLLLMINKTTQQKSSPPPPNVVDLIEPSQTLPSTTSMKKCDIFSGEWVPNSKGPYYTNKTCWAIHEHQNCMKYGRPDSEFMKWRWKPNDCELPIFNPFQFLEIVRGKSMAFVGDSVGRNHMQSLICLLSRAQLREVTLKEENAAFENAILDCENKIKEKSQEAELLRNKLEEMDQTELKLRAELDNMRMRASVDGGRSWISEGSEEENKANAKDESDADAEVSKAAMLEKLEKKKKELSSMEDTVKALEKKWAEVQENALKQPSPAQREKTLDKQLHGLLEQLAVKQTQAEGLLNEIHLKEMELERLNGQWRQLQSNNSEVNNARNRFVKGSSDKLHGLSDYEGHQRLPYHSAGRTESQQRLMLLRSAFVLYILALNIVVFIRISF